MSTESIWKYTGQMAFELELKAMGQATLKELERLQFRVAALEVVGDKLAEAGDGLTINPKWSGRDERERAWIDAYIAWEKIKADK